MSIIKRVTIACQQGTKSYELGEVKNGLKIVKIKDLSIEYEDAFHSIYVGFTEDEQRVFETYNAPTDVEYTNGDEPLPF